MNHQIVFLYIEDDPNDVELLKTVLHRQHIGTLRVVEDGQAAIDYLTAAGLGESEDHPMPSVILLDLKMPRLDGFGFLLWLRASAPQHLRCLPAVVMSSSDESKDVTRAYSLGANCYLTKPVDWRLFQERMRLLGIFWAEHAEVPAV